MLPIALNLSTVPILLIGQGAAFDKRAAQLRAGGAGRLTAHEASSADDAMLAPHAVILVAGLAREQAEAIAGQARALGKLVNVEDVNDLCDFYYTAHITRGDLTIAVSTSGASPTLAKAIRNWLAGRFGQEWAHYTQELAEMRLAWKRQGVSMQEVATRSEAVIAQKGWLTLPKLSLSDPHPNPPPLRGREQPEQEML